MLLTYCILFAVVNVNFLIIYVLYIYLITFYQGWNC